MEDALLDPFMGLLRKITSAERARETEKSDPPAEPLWQDIEESGFLSALVPEDAGGFGLEPVAMSPLLLTAGKHLLPAPFGETLVARALAAVNGVTLPAGEAVALWPMTQAGGLASAVRPQFTGARYLLRQRGRQAKLVRARRSDGGADGFGFVTIEPDDDEWSDFGFELPEDCLLHWAAALTAIQMAGSMQRVVELSIAHVTDRQQFGRPLGKFQAIQQQISVLAERAALAEVAARKPFGDSLSELSEMDAATAKTVADACATSVCAISHAVHGAIGMSAEYELQLHTRRLKRNQLLFGGGTYWSCRIGAARLDAPPGSSVDFVRTGGKASSTGERA